MATLPRFSRGLKLTRFGIIAMLIQLALTIVVTVRAMAISDAEDAQSVVEWTGRYILVHIGASGLMLVGTAMSLGELARAGLAIRNMILAALGFAIATAAMAWTYYAFNAFVDVLMNPDSVEQVEAAAARLENVKFVAAMRSVGYGLGLILVLGMVQRSAHANDQLGLAEDAGHMKRACIVMFLGDVFYQVTFGLGGPVGLIGLAGSLLIAGYWIWCHVKLVRFFENAAHFVNEPHDLPIATGIKVPEVADLKPKKKPPAARVSRPSMPQAPPPPLQIARPSAPAMPAPASPSKPEDAPPTGDGPKFLR